MAKRVASIRGMGEGFLKRSPFSLPMIGTKKGKESYFGSRQYIRGQV